LNLCYDELRRRYRRRESSLEAQCEDGSAAPAADDASPDVSMVRSETAERVRAGAGAGFQVSPNATFNMRIDSGAPTTMNLRVKKSDVDAFAK